ncbi:MAG TPA: hypothetical protein PKI89_03660 [Tepidiformaceae bacterium]|nr:hypothetical protein [Tepidiformaceae bacterium]
MRIFLIILGAVIALFGFACGASGLAAYRSVGPDGYVEGGGHMSTATAAFVTDTATFEKVEEGAGSRAGSVKLRISAERSDGGPVLVGIARATDLEAYLANGSSATVRHLSFGPFDYASVAQGGTRALPPPESALFAASASGSGRQQVVWPVESGSWRAIIMNADGSEGVEVDARFAVRFPYLRGFAIVAMVFGGVLLVTGLLLVVFQARRKRPPAATPETPAPEPPPA